MKAQTGINVWVAAVLVLLVVAIYLGYFIPKQSEIANQEFFPGCPKNVKLRYDCPCNTIPVRTGYCCESGPSDKPCGCGEKVIKCSDYKSEDNCAGASDCDAKKCSWSKGLCS